MFVESIFSKCIIPFFPTRKHRFIVVIIPCAAAENKRAPFVRQTKELPLMVDDTRLEPAGAGASARRPQSDPRASRAQIGHKLKTHTFSKKNSHPVGWLFFLVDDTRLELVTSRTSSGCATSCANRPSLFQLGHFTSRGITCQVFFQRKQKKTAFFCALRCT